MDPNDNVPPTTMAFMLNMLPQAFMSYVMNYGEALKAIRNEGLKQVAELGDADYVTKLLILHDWISQVAEFDMGSMGDITGGGNNDPIRRLLSVPCWAARSALRALSMAASAWAMQLHLTTWSEFA